MSAKSRHNRRKIKCSVCVAVMCYDSFSKHVKQFHAEKACGSRAKVLAIEIGSPTPSITSFFTKDSQSDVNLKVST